MDVVSKQKEALQTGDYLDGHFSWTEAVTLTSAKVRGNPPAGGLLEITLEIADALTDVVFYIPSGTQEHEQVLALNRRLPAGQEIRWKVTRFTGDAGQESTRLAITVGAFTAEAEALPTVESDLHVLWVNGGARLRLFDYTPTLPPNERFTEHATGLAASRAAFVPAASPDQGISVEILGETVLDLPVDQTLRVETLSETGVGLTDPHLEFMRGRRWLASLDQAGMLYVPALEERAVISGASDRFVLYAGGVVAATIAREGTTVMDLVEGLT